MASSDDLVFYGLNGDECERFVAAVTQAAFQEKKMRDPTWMADLAVAGLRGKALRWYTTLDEDVQSSWRLLQKALVEKYPQADDRTEAESPSIASTIPTPAAAPPPSFSADGSSTSLSAGHEYSQTDLLPQVDLVPSDSTIPTPAAAPPSQTPSNSAWSVVKSGSEGRNRSSDSLASADSKSLVKSFEPLSIAPSIFPHTFAPLLPSVPWEPSDSNASASAPWITSRIGVIKILTDDSSYLKYVPRSHYGSFLGGKTKGTMMPTDSIKEALVVKLMPPDIHGLRTMELMNYKGSAALLGLKWYEKIPDPTPTSYHECALVPLVDLGKGDELMGCKLPSLYWSGPTRPNIWVIDQSTMKLTPTYRNPFEGVKYPLQVILNMSGDDVEFPIEMVPGFDYWKKILTGMKAELVFVPL